LTSIQIIDNKHWSGMWEGGKAWDGYCS